jgi:hypothetical protein
VSIRHQRLSELADVAARCVGQESRLHRLIGVRAASIIQGFFTFIFNALRGLALITNAH